MTINKLI